MSDVQSLMNEIKNFDSEPSIFTVSLVAADHRSGFAANVVFRSNVEGAASYLEAHGNTPEEALSILLNTLKAKWGKCPHCGNYSHGAVQQSVQRTRLDAHVECKVFVKTENGYECEVCGKPPSR